MGRYQCSSGSAADQQQFLNLGTIDILDLKFFVVGTYALYDV